MANRAMEEETNDDCADVDVTAGVSAESAKENNSGRRLRSTAATGRASTAAATTTAATASGKQQETAAEEKSEHSPQPFVCKYCQCRFATLEICCQHVRTAHALPKFDQSKQGGADSAVGRDGGGGEREVFPKPEYIAYLNRCRSCGMSFGKPSELTEHYVEKHDPQFKVDLAIRRKRAEKRRKENRRKELTLEEKISLAERAERAEESGRLDDSTVVSVDADDTAPLSKAVKGASLKVDDDDVALAKAKPSILTRKRKAELLAAGDLEPTQDDSQ